MLSNFKKSARGSVFHCGCQIRQGSNPCTVHAVHWRLDTLGWKHLRFRCWIESLECKQVCSSASVCAGSATITQHIYRARSPLLRGCESGVIGCPATVLVKLPICSNGSHISTPQYRITHRSPENYSCKLVFVRPAQFWVEAEVISVLFANCPIPRHCYELGQNFNHFTAFNVTLK